MQDYIYMSIEEVAFYLNVNKMTIRRYMRKNSLPYYQIEKGAILRFDKNQIDSWYKKYQKGKF